MQWSRAQVDELLGFENEQLIATESLQERNERATRALALEAIAGEEFEQAMVALDRSAGDGCLRFSDTRLGSMGQPLTGTGVCSPEHGLIPASQIL